MKRKGVGVPRVARTRAARGRGAGRVRGTATGAKKGGGMNAANAAEPGGEVGPRLAREKTDGSPPEMAC